MSETRYTKDHEWIRIEGEEGVMGITSYAADQLGDVVFVELPEVGKSFKQGDEMAVVESVKAASEVYAPVSGEIVAVNDALDGEPGKVNEAPDADGWFVKIKIADKGELEGLMDEAAYKAHVE
ncbi:MAG: glycine cleavage system protein GcvH [Alphaproteobacteria bacterium]|nr:glycine cleavage system protein GcvH [Alphaproteobacteria bacterium]